MNFEQCGGIILSYISSHARMHWLMNDSRHRTARNIAMIVFKIGEQRLKDFYNTTVSFFLRASNISTVVVSKCITVFKKHTHSPMITLTLFLSEELIFPDIVGF